LTAEQLNVVYDLIVARNILQAVIAIRKYTGLGVNAAADLLRDRYTELRRVRPSDFSCSDEEYWRDVYS
jgi:hypothetical protein